jgi:hypothetical protein
MQQDREGRNRTERRNQERPDEDEETGGTHKHTIVDKFRF